MWMWHFTLPQNSLIGYYRDEVGRPMEMSATMRWRLDYLEVCRVRLLKQKSGNGSKAGDQMI
jgi:hypothetical protein